MNNYLESDEQILFINWLRMNYPDVITIICPVVSHGTVLQRIKHWVLMKKLGYMKGTPDIFIPLPVNGFCGLFIELKRKSGGSKQENQKEMAMRLNKLGYKSVFCRGFEEAKKEFLSYLGA